MQKMADYVKIAEINGVMGCLLDADLVKIASEEDLDVVVEAIADRLPEDYDLDTVLGAVDDVMEQYDDATGGEMGKESSAYGMPSEMELMAMLGQLQLEKTAGTISEMEFLKEAGGVMDILRAIGNTAKRSGKTLWDRGGEIGRSAWGGVTDAAGRGKEIGGSLWGGTKDLAGVARQGLGEGYAGAKEAIRPIRERPGKLKEIFKEHSGRQGQAKADLARLKADMADPNIGKSLKDQLKSQISDAKGELWKNRRNLAGQLKPELLTAGGLAAGGTGYGIYKDEVDEQMARMRDRAAAGYDRLKDIVLRR